MFEVLAKFFRFSGKKNSKNNVESICQGMI